MNKNNSYSISAIRKLSSEEAEELLGSSSGLSLEENEGLITIGYIDFDVPCFGGGDYECHYYLDLRNSNLLKESLGRLYTGDLFEQCIQAFSIKFSDDQFEDFCSENNIQYTKKTYC